MLVWRARTCTDRLQCSIKMDLRASYPADAVTCLGFERTEPQERHCSWPIKRERGKERPKHRGKAAELIFCWLARLPGLTGRLAG